jgi:hypothetical protein
MEKTLANLMKPREAFHQGGFLAQGLSGGALAGVFVKAENSATSVSFPGNQTSLSCFIH